MKSTAKEIVALKNADLAFRNKLIQQGKLEEGYNPEMEAIHNANAQALSEIIDTIGYPTVTKVGPEASEAAWLIIQHAISQPAFMRKCAELLAEAVRENEANPLNLAYLTDRIATFEGKPQLYGTQFDWDENGAMSPKPYDDQADQRRKTIGLNTIAEQTTIMRQRVVEENQAPPMDIEKRSREYEAWRMRVGWVK